MGIVLFGPGIAIEAGKCKNDNHAIPNQYHTTTRSIVMLDS